jgi:hypothetical protein
MPGSLPFVKRGDPPGTAEAGKKDIITILPQQNHIGLTFHPFLD